MFEKSYGFGRVKNNEIATPESNYRLASVSKQFTALAALLLVDRKLLRLDDTLTDIFPDFPKYGKNITVYQLLTHTSGLQKHEKNLPSGLNRPLKDADVYDILVKLKKGLFKPGSRYQYSDSGYVMLSNVVTKVSGKSFADFLRDEVFSVLGMNTSVAFEKGRSVVENRVYGHRKSGSRYIEADQNFFSSLLGDGGVYSNLRELFLWDQALYGSELLSEELMTQIFSRGRLKNGSPINYGFGWRIRSHKGKKLVSHSGSTIGFKNIYLRVPSKKLSVIVLTNRQSPYPRSEAYKLIDMFWNL